MFTNNNIYLDAGYNIGLVSSFWQGYFYSGLSAKVGSRWKVKGTNYSTYSLGFQLTWIYYSVNKRMGENINSYGYGVGFVGLGISNMFRINKTLVLKSI